MKTLFCRTNPRLTRIYQHPFNQSLCRGDLPKPIFLDFLRQDTFYLDYYSKALHIVANRLTNESHALEFQKFYKDTVAYELLIHQHYLQPLPRISFFNNNHLKIKPLPAVSEYSAYLLSMAKEASVEEAVFSLMACFLVFSELGEQIEVVNCDPNHPYLEWIKSCSSEEFRDSTKQFVQIAGELKSGVTCLEQRNKMELGFWKSVDFEYRFLEEIYCSSELKPGLLETDSGSISFNKF